MNKQQLIQRRDELRERLAAIKRDLRSGLDRDLSEQAVQLENRETLLEIGRLAEQELATIEQQLSTSGPLD